YFLRTAAGAWEDDWRTLIPLDSEQENLLAALEHGRAAALPELWAGLAGFLMHSFMHGNNRLALPWTAYALAAAPSIADPDMRCRLRFAATTILTDVGDFAAALDAAAELKSDAEAHGSTLRALEADALTGYVLCRKGEPESALEIQRRTLPQIRLLDGGVVLCRALSLTTMALIETAVAKIAAGSCGLGEYVEAESVGRQLIEALPPHSRFWPTALQMMGMTLAGQRRMIECYSFFKRSQQLAIVHRRLAVLMLGFFVEAEASLLVWEFERGARMLGAALKLQERIAYTAPTADETRQRLMAAFGARMSNEALDRQLQIGRASSLSELAADRIPDSAIGRAAADPLVVDAL
ncbi:MAG TPA: hypothetical protein VKT77_20005, partial [Chthonomonadaceae bacterium]|nr:hypothetical protein [Chthonomonadaceae bacterium]